MKKKIYLIQPTYRNPEGKLFKGNKVEYASLALPALSATIPPDWEKEFCIEYFDDVNYDTDASVIGISSMGYDILHGAEIAGEFKQRGKVVMFGGPQANIHSDKLHGVSDTVVRGNPGPREMRLLLEDVLAGRTNPVYDGGMHINFPFDYSVLAGKKMQFMPVLTSIGCRNTCSFCSTASLYNGHYRLRNIEYVLADVKAVCRTSRDMVFGDANIFNNREYLARLCLRLIEEKLNIRWGAQCTVDIGDDPELLGLLKKSGCLILLLGLETLDQRNMEGFGKHYDLRQNGPRIARIRQAGIEVGGYFMLGLDNDTADSFDALFDFIHDNRIALPILNLLLPAPGTITFDQLKTENRLLIQDEEEFLRNNARYATASSHCFYTPKNMTVEEAEAGFLRLYGRLTAIPEIVRRSWHPNPFTAVLLLMLNLEMRSDYNAMRDMHRLETNLLVERI